MCGRNPAACPAPLGNRQVHTDKEIQTPGPLQVPENADPTSPAMVSLKDSPSPGLESVPEFVDWGVTLAGKRTAIIMTRMHACAQVEECELLTGLRRRQWLPCSSKDPQDDHCPRRTSRSSPLTAQQKKGNYEIGNTRLAMQRRSCKSNCIGSAIAKPSSCTDEKR
jgi:hypothetical protein